MNPETINPYYYTEKLTPADARKLGDSLEKDGFRTLETVISKKESSKLLIDKNGNEILVIVDPIGIEVTSDYPASPIIRDRG